MSNPAKLYILGSGGQTEFGALPDWTPERMITDPTLEAIGNAGVEPKDVQAGYIGNCAGGLFCAQNLSSAFLSHVHPDLKYKPSTRVENACASASGAALDAMTAVLAGLYDVVVVTGWEKMRGESPKPDMGKVGEVLGTCAHPKDRAEGGLIFPRTFAKFMAAHMKRFGSTEEQFAHISVKNTKHANMNPLAQMRTKSLDLATAAAAGDKNPYMFPDLGLPLKARDCSQVTDGSAAIVLCSTRFYEKLGKPKNAVKVIGLGQASDLLDLEQRDLSEPQGLRAAIGTAFRSADLPIGAVDFAEVHDCFTVAEAMVYEALGKAELGQGPALAASGETLWTGSFPVNTSGGRIGMGHPVGATGVAMLRELSLQHLGLAGERQVAKTGRACSVNFGGPMAAIYTFITEAV